MLGRTNQAGAPKAMKGTEDERPNSDQILVWNSFIIKRGWRDDGAPGLIVEKELNGCAHRDDIQTYVDLHDADEGRTPRFSRSTVSGPCGLTG